MRQGDFVVDTSLVGVVMNGLSHLRGAECTSDFTIKLVRGLGANLPEATRINFAKEVRKRSWCCNAQPESILRSLYGSLDKNLIVIYIVPKIGLIKLCYKHIVCLIALRLNEL